MIEIQGSHNTAICYTPQLEKAAAGQIKAVCDQEAFAGSKIRVMPDVHAGMGCTIGTTMTISDKSYRAWWRVDIGARHGDWVLGEREINFRKRWSAHPRRDTCGREIADKPHSLNDAIDLSESRARPYVKVERALRSIGTLGGGNHFIEVDKGEAGELFLVVHSGSRHIGNEVAKYYQEEGFHALCGNARFQIDETIRQMKDAGNTKEIHKTIKELKKRRAMLTPIPKDLAYVEGSLFDDYIHDMRIIQHFAVLNRKAMTEVILSGMGLTRVEEFTTIHNYIDTEAMILRKGAVSAKQGEKLLIPINMRDGALICIGRGNEEWNCSAPHGAGRLMSRKDAFIALSMEEYKAEMDGIYTTCVVPDTLDESPMAYKSMDEIISQIGPTADIVERILPAYNFKASE
jgi:RNA-splicing ligase RtcB